MCYKPNTAREACLDIIIIILIFKAYSSTVDKLKRLVLVLKMEPALPFAICGVSRLVPFLPFGKRFKKYDNNFFKKIRNGVKGTRCRPGGSPSGNSRCRESGADPLSPLCPGLGGAEPPLTPSPCPPPRHTPAPPPRPAPLTRGGAGAGRVNETQLFPTSGVRLFLSAI